MATLTLDENKQLCFSLIEMAQVIGEFRLAKWDWMGNGGLASLAHTNLVGLCHRYSGASFCSMNSFTNSIALINTVIIDLKSNLMNMADAMGVCILLQAVIDFCDAFFKSEDAIDTALLSLSKAS